MQRQSFVALDALSSMQAYQAWVLLRPGLECALIMGKWMDDNANYHIWINRLQDPEAYRTTYSGKKMVSRSLPRSRDLQQVLKAINDSFVHPNPEYWATERKDLPLVDVKATGGWRDTNTLLTCYQQTDEASMLRVMNAPSKLRSVG